MRLDRIFTSLNESVSEFHMDVILFDAVHPPMLYFSSSPHQFAICLLRFSDKKGTEIVQNFIRHG